MGFVLMLIMTGLLMMMLRMMMAAMMLRMADDMCVRECFFQKIMLILKMSMKMWTKMMAMMATMANAGWVGEYFGQTATHWWHATSFLFKSVFSSPHSNESTLSLSSFSSLFHHRHSPHSTSLKLTTHFQTTREMLRSTNSNWNTTCIYV